MKTAVKELENKLIKEKDTTYKGIDSLMRIIMRKYDLTAKELHNAFVNKHHKTPDEWIKEMLNEGKKENIRKQIEYAYDLGSQVPNEIVRVMSSPEDVMKYSGGGLVKRAIKDKQKRRERNITTLTKAHMKTFKEFCEDANLQELFGLWSVASRSSPPPPPPAQTRVLAHQNYKPGVLDKATGKFTQRAFTSAEQQRYGWKPVRATSYSPGDKFTPNKVTATGEPHNWTTMNAASPFKYPEGKFPKGSKQEAQPSIPYGSKLQLTKAPMGTKSGSTRVTTSKLNDVGDFGTTGHKNPDVSFDLSPNTVRSVTGDRKTPDSQISSKWGKGMVYTRVLPPSTGQKSKK